MPLQSTAQCGLDRPKGVVRWECIEPLLLNREVKIVKTELCGRQMKGGYERRNKEDWAVESGDKEE